MEHWYLACHKAGRHNAFKAQMFLSRMGITVFIPQVCFRQPRSDRLGYFRNKFELLFPGYLFISFNHDEHPISKIVCSPGMSHFVRFGGVIRPLNDMIVDELMQLTLTIDSDGSLVKKRSPKVGSEHQKLNNITESQRDQINLIIQETDSDTRSTLFYAFLDAIKDESVS